MSEMALTAEHLIVIGRGELIADMDIDGVRAAGLQERGARALTPDGGADSRCSRHRTSRLRLPNRG